MAAGGYVPSREQMAAIINAAQELFLVTQRWQERSCLPGYPVERGNSAALESLFRLERALNPRCLAWDRPNRKSLQTECWPPPVVDCLTWLRNLLDIILERNQLESMATAASLAAWLADDPPIPAVISIMEKELEALRLILQDLPGPEKLPEPALVPIPGSSPNPAPVSLADSLAGSLERLSPVRLFGPGTKPIVLGRQKKPLTGARYLVVKALLDAGEAGLSKAELETLCGDAVNVLKRLADSDPDWKMVIKLAKKKGNRYRIGPADPELDSADVHEKSSQEQPSVW